MNDFMRRLDAAKRVSSDEEAAAAEAQRRLSHFHTEMHQRLLGGLKELEKMYVCTVSTSSPRSAPYMSGVLVSIPTKFEKRLFRPERVVFLHEFRVSYSVYEIRHPPESAGKYATPFTFDVTYVSFRDDGTRSESDPVSLDPQVTNRRPDKGSAELAITSIEDALDYSARCLHKILEVDGVRRR